MAGSDGSIWSCLAQHQNGGRGLPRGTSGFSRPNLGRPVRRRKARLNKHGYPVVNLSISGKIKLLTVHRLVAFAFIGHPPTPDHQVRHLNGRRSDNRPSNLMWGTLGENMQDRDLHDTTARGIRDGNHVLTEGEVACIKARLVPFHRGLVSALAREFGVSKCTISSIRLGKTWRHIKAKSGCPRQESTCP